MGFTPSIVPTARTGGQMNKIVSAREAVRLVRTGNTVAIGGFGASAWPKS